MPPVEIAGLPEETRRAFEQLTAYLGPLREQVRFGNGTPEGAVYAERGTLYERLNGGAGTSFYIKESAGTLNTGWVAVASGGGGGAPAAHATTHQPGGTDAMAVDAAAGTGSLRTLGTGATQAMPGNTAVGGTVTFASHAKWGGLG